MRPGEIIECLELNPIIAAIRDDGWDAALHSPAQVLFYLSADLTTVADCEKIHLILTTVCLNLLNKCIKLLCTAFCTHSEITAEVINILVTYVLSDFF